jgi:hypothetical protein
VLLTLRRIRRRAPLRSIAQPTPRAEQDPRVDITAIVTLATGESSGECGGGVVPAVR